MLLVTTRFLACNDNIKYKIRISDFRQLLMYKNRLFWHFSWALQFSTTKLFLIYLKGLNIGLHSTMTCNVVVTCYNELLLFL